MHLKRWVGPPYYRSSLPFIARVELRSIFCSFWTSSHFKARPGAHLINTGQHSMYLFPKLTKNTKVESATRYPDHQILFQSQGSPLPIFHFPRHGTSPSPNSGTTWSFVQVCVTQVRVPRKLCPPSSMPASIPTHPPTHLNVHLQCSPPLSMPSSQV